MALSIFNFVMIFIVHKMLAALLKNHLNYLKDNVLECFLKSVIDFYFFKQIIFFVTYNNGKV